MSDDEQRNIANYVLRGNHSMIALAGYYVADDAKIQVLSLVSALCDGLL